MLQLDFIVPQRRPPTYTQPLTDLSPTPPPPSHTLTDTQPLTHLQEALQRRLVPPQLQVILLLKSPHAADAALPQQVLVARPHALDA